MVQEELAKQTATGKTKKQKPKKEKKKASHIFYCWLEYNTIVYQPGGQEINQLHLGEYIDLNGGDPQE